MYKQIKRTKNKQQKNKWFYKTRSDDGSILLFENCISVFLCYTCTCTSEYCNSIHNTAEKHVVKPIKWSVTHITIMSEAEVRYSSFLLKRLLYWLISIDWWIGAGSAEIEHLLNERSIRNQSYFVFANTSGKLFFSELLSQQHWSVCKNEINGIPNMLLSVNKCSISALPKHIYISIE